MNPPTDNDPSALAFPCDVERLANGNTLITDAGDETCRGSKIIEVNPDGQWVWSYDRGLQFAHSAKRLTNGHTLISDTTHDRVIEVDPGGQIVFSSDNWGTGTGTMSDGTRLHYPNDAHALDDDRLIITDRNNNRFVIVKRDGTVERTFGQDIKHPHNCDLLPSGNVLLADSDGNRVIEVDPQGRTVWSYDGKAVGGLNWPRDADRTPDGHTLITDSKNGRLLRVAGDGQVLWTYEAGYFANYYDADLLDNGNVLASDQQHHQVLEIDPQGEIVWRYRNYHPPYTTQPRLTNGSFKQRDEGTGHPTHWLLYNRFAEGGGELIWDEQASPRPAPGLAFDRPGALCLFQVVTVSPGTRYRLAGSIRTAGMRPGSAAYFQLAFLDSQGGLLCDAADAPKGDVFAEDTDWTPDDFEAVAPDQAVAVEVRLLLAGEGRAWMKGLMLFS